DRQIGEGVNGVVYEARDLRLKRRVAVKLWKKKVADPKSRAEHEIRKIAGLSHPLLVTIHRFQIIDGWPCAVMEFVSGVTLREFLRVQTLTLKDRCAIWNLFSTAMRFIYSTGKVHGDPHVGNVIVFKDPKRVYKSYIDDHIHPKRKFGLKLADTGT